MTQAAGRSCRSHYARLKLSIEPTLPDLSGLFAFACGPVSFFDRLRFSHVLALLGRAVKTRAFPVEYMRVRVNPHQAVAAAGCRRIRRSRGAGFLCGSAAHSSGTGCSGTFWLE